jgi:RHS repeat-associated protein
VLSDGGNQFGYDELGRLVAVSNDKGITQYAINGLGQRVAKLGPETSRYFVYDEAGRLLGEYDGSWRVPVQEFVYLDDMLVAVLRREGFFFVYPDHLGTPRAIADEIGNVVWRWDSDPFGATPPPDEDADRNGHPFTFNLRFPGQYFDQETGLFHNGFRDYDPQAGRYIQADPIGLAGGINPYLYAEGNPLTFYDPYGLGATDGSANTTNDSESGGQCGGGIVDGGSSSARDTPARTCNTCFDMADVAQFISNQSLASSGGNLAAAVKDFEMAFSQVYLSRSMVSNYDAWELWRNPLRERTITRSWLGQGGFRAEYGDKETRDDQTHHFAAYFSAGFHGLGAAPLAHMIADLAQLNPGDARLGGAAHRLGSVLAAHPDLLRQIGATIRDEICAPK